MLYLTFYLPCLTISWAIWNRGRANPVPIEFAGWRRGLKETEPDLFFGGQQRFDLGAQRVIRRAGLVKESGSLVRSEEHRAVQELFHLLPGYVCLNHGDAARLI